MAGSTTNPATDPAATHDAYRLLVETSTDIIVRADLNGRLLYVSPACRVLGYEPEELIGQPAAALVHPDDLARFAAGSAALFSGAPVDRTADRAYRYLAKDGDWVWLEGNPQVRRDETGKPVEILNAFRDVTERKRIEQALEAARAQQDRHDERMAAAVGAAQVGIWEWDLEADTLIWDERMHELYARRSTGAQTSFAGFEDSLHLDDKARVLAELQAAVAGEAAFDTEFRIVASGGSVRHIRAMATIVFNASGAPLRMVGTNWDITATRLLEASLRASETRMQKVISNANQAIVTVDESGSVTGWNRHAELIFGWTASEAFGEMLGDLVFPPQTRAERSAGFARFLAAGQGAVVEARTEVDALRKTGEEFPIEMAVSAIPGPAGWEITLLMQDISERRAQTALFENAFHHAPIGMALVGLNGEFLKINQAFCQIVGYPEPEMLGLDFQTITHPDDLNADLGLLTLLAAGDIPNYQMDKRYVRADGVIVWVRLSVSMVIESDGRPRHFVAQVEDLTARREAEDRYRLLADASSDVVLKMDMDDVINYVSPSVRRYGYAPDEMVGRRGAEFVHPDDLGRVLGMIATLTAGGPLDRSIDPTYRIVTADGGEAWVESNASLVCDESGAPKGIVSQIRDIAERRAAMAALAESERRYRLLTDNATDVIACYGADGVFTFLSPSLTSVMGYEPHKMVGKASSNFMHPDDVRPALRRFSAYLAAGPTADPIRFEYRAYRKDGEMIWLEAQAKAIYDEAGQFVEFQDVVRDITARVALDVELRAARDAAQAAAAAKSDFMANMSHEIRTPLTAILGFTRLLSGREGLDETAQTHVARVAGAGEALLSIVNDILDFSKLEAGQVEIAPRPVDPGELLRDALLLFSPQADAKGLTLEFASGELPACVSLDPDRLRQILLNLIGNAIKFTETGGVRLVGAYDLAAQRLELRVEDSGPGLSQAQQRKLFQRFSQVDASTTRRHGGTGLGLAICKGLAEAMGGQIGVTSRPGEGSCFFFAVAAPLAQPPVRTIGPHSAGASLDGVRVLVVDDNPMNRELARAVLEHMGAEVSDAEDGLTAVAAAHTLPYDVILLDIRMPGLDGPATLARIRGEPGPNQDVPVIAFSADADLGRFAAEGFDGMVSKPVDPAALAAAIARAVQWDPQDLEDADARFA